jgi:hypothetical protein
VSFTNVTITQAVTFNLEAISGSRPFHFRPGPSKKVDGLSQAASASVPDIEHFN